MGPQSPPVTPSPSPHPETSDPRERAQRSLHAQYAVTQAIVQTMSLEDAMPRVLHAMGVVGDWTVGAFWSLDEGAQVLRCVHVWSPPGADVQEFEAVTREMTCRPGTGLPGRVWASGEPAWIPDVAQESTLPRAPYARRAGLCSALGFPIRVRDRITGVLEFFARDARQPDPELSRLFNAFGTQIGQFIERRQFSEIRERLAAIVDSSDDAIISKTLDGVITSWNRGAEQVFGYTAAEAVGQHIYLIIPEERHAEEDDVLARLRRGERIAHFETERRTKDGRRRQISLTVSPVRNVDGQIIGASKVARDITERKEAEDALRASERRAQEQAAITDKLNRVGAAVAATLDRQTVVQTVTDLATELTGAEFGAFFYNVTDPASGESFLLYTLSGAPREAFARFPQPRATALFGPTFRGEGIVRIDDVTLDSRYGLSAPHHGMPEGHLPVRSYLAVPVRTRSGEVLGGLFFGHSTVGVFTRQHEQLVEGIAAWASVALENARLYADAAQAIQTRDEFISIASHELHNPIGALQLQLVGLVRAAQRRDDGSLPSEWVRERVGQAVNDVARLVRLVHSLLDVSRINAGRLELELEDVDFGALLDTVVERLGSQVKPGQLTIDLKRQVTGRWDRLRLDQIATNLLTNAVKYGNGQPITVTLDGNEDTVVLVVADRGIGMDAQAQSRLFERFQRSVSRRDYGGFGLGLWITRRIVDTMGGTITVTSAPQAGSTFTVTLPLQPPEPGATRESDRTDRQPAETPEP